MHRTKVRIVEDVLDANNTIARANREDFDRAGVCVVNLMSAPGRARPRSWNARWSTWLGRGSGPVFGKATWPAA